jgi:hypothetical protein
VEYDLQKFNLDGVTWHPSRFWIELRNWADEVEDTGEDSDTVFERFLEIMRGEIPISRSYHRCPGNARRTGVFRCEITLGDNAISTGG